MKIRVLGFDWQMGAGISVSDFLHFLEDTPLIEENLILSVTKKDDYYIGILLAIRDQKRFAKIKQERGKFEIKTEELGKNENPVEFNFFLINKETGRGLYQHYYHSTPLNSFNVICKRRYTALKASRIQSDTPEDASESKKAKIRKQFAGGLSYSLWVRPEKFEEVVKMLARVKSLEVDVNSLDVSDRLFQPLAKHAKGVRHRFTFNEQQGRGSAKTAVLKLLKDSLGDFLGAKVVGVDPDDNEVVYRLAENLDTLFEMDLDEALKGLVLRSDDMEATIRQSHMATQLIAIAQSPKVKAVLTTPQESS